MNTDQVKPLIKARSLTMKQKMMFFRNGVKAECRRRDNAWFEIDMIAC